MKKTSISIAAWALAALLVLWGANRAEALGLDGATVKAGVNLTRQQTYDIYQGIGGQFDGHRWMLGGNFDLGQVFIPKLHFVPGGDYVVQSNLKIFVLNTDFVYFFHQSPKGRGYAGVGWGTHFYRPGNAPNDVKISLNVPLGFQRKLGAGLAWTGEMKLVIADDQRDSALQFSIGLSFGSQE